MLQIHIGVQKHKISDRIDNVILTNSWMKFIVLPLFILYVFICIQSSKCQIIQCKIFQVHVLCIIVYGVANVVLVACKRKL